MKKIALPVLCDGILSGFIAYALFKYALRESIKNKTALFILAVCFSAAVSLTVFTFLNRKSQAFSDEKNTEKQLLSILSKLELCTDNELIDLFLPIFIKHGTEFEVTKNTIVTDTTVFAFCYAKSTERQTAVNAVKNANGKKVVLFCNAPTTDCLEFAETQKSLIKLIDERYIFPLKKAFGITFPEQVTTEKASLKRRIVLKIKTLATFKRAATLALAGGMLLLFSSLTFYRVWYLIWGFALLIFAAVLTVMRIANRAATHAENENLSETLFNRG